jgi:hypothetical protein
LRRVVPLPRVPVYFAPLPLAHHRKNSSSWLSGNDSRTVTVPLGAVAIDLIFTGIYSPSSAPILAVARRFVCSSLVPVIVMVIVFRVILFKVL